ncbi:MAG: hypothetical protein AUK44_03195 [Porphyromonadaceae bacterium CG2_30_38_12]|nr:MAG: hypothetical protein AUK44_03195 [Porphyromonadaceae bacterium CG2_30_38_12]
MEIIHTISALDKQLFLFLNSFHNGFFDLFMSAVSAKIVWLPFYISLLYIIIRSLGKQSIWVILTLILCVVIADQVSSGIIKNAVQRLRPSHNPDFENFIHLVNGHKSGLYGFVSSHASNAVGLATLSALLIRNKSYSITVAIWAGIVMYSRIYLGVHYPLDVIGGATVGALVAFALYVILQKYIYKTKQITIWQPQMPILMLMLSAIAFVLYGFMA